MQLMMEAHEGTLRRPAAQGTAVGGEHRGGRLFEAQPEEEDVAAATIAVAQRRRASRGRTALKRLAGDTGRSGGLKRRMGRCDGRLTRSPEDTSTAVTFRTEAQQGDLEAGGRGKPRQEAAARLGSSRQG